MVASAPTIILYMLLSKPTEEQMGPLCSGKLMAMDAFQGIIEDHKRFLNIVDEMQGRNTSRRSDQMRQLAEDLRAHMRAEEQTLYEQLKNEGGELKDLALIQYEAHHVFDILLDELQRTEMDNDIWNAKLSVFRQYLKLHMDLEESDVLSTVQEFFPDDQLAAMEQDFEAIEKNILLRR